MSGPGLDTFGEEERSQLLEVLNERHLSRYRFNENGEALPSKVYMFERRMEEMTGVRHCLGMNSCTSALLAGMWAAGLGPGDEVIVPGYMFVASIATIAYVGAQPVLAEIDESLTLDPNDVQAKITPRTRAILAVHMLGAQSDLCRLQEIAAKKGLLLIEDCAQAGGGGYFGRCLGAIGDFGVFSLNVFKTFTAGDGGVLLTSNTELYHKAFAIHDHGAKPFRVGVEDTDSFLGLNFRMHELTGAVAGAQLGKLPNNIKKLRHNKLLFQQAIGEVPLAMSRKIHDPESECATVLAYIFDTPALAEAVARNLGSITLSNSGKHYYANIPQLLQMKVPVRRPYCEGSTGGYRKGDLPRTDELLSRTVALSIGVVDSYLGTSFGIDINSDQQTIEIKAKQFKKALKDATEKCS